MDCNWQTLCFISVQYSNHVDLKEAASVQISQHLLVLVNFHHCCCRISSTPHLQIQSAHRSNATEGNAVLVFICYPLLCWSYYVLKEMVHWFFMNLPICFFALISIIHQYSLAPLPSCLETNVQI